MATAALDYSYRYLLPSEISTTGEGKLLLLSTSLDGDRYPYFFEGKIHQPAVLARLLSTVSRVVGTRYYIPPNMLGNVLALSDPVVTSGGGILRFEGFSTCCSSYVKLPIRWLKGFAEVQRDCCYRLGSLATAARLCCVC